MAEMDVEAGGDSEGFTSFDVVQRVSLLTEKSLEVVVDAAELPIC